VDLPIPEAETAELKKIYEGFEEYISLPPLNHPLLFAQQNNSNIAPLCIDKSTISH
jgi:hypothetical protein